MTSNDDSFDWTRYEAEVVDLDAERARRDGTHPDDQATEVLVDTIAAQRPGPVTLAGLRAAQRRPIVPAWLRSRSQARDTTLWAIGYTTHTAVYHLTRVPKYAGRLALRAPVGADAWIVRTVYINGPTADAIAGRARAARDAVGALTGHAAGQAPIEPAATRRDTLLDDILTVVALHEAKVWTETVLDRLTGLRPAVYAGMTREQVTAALKAAGIPTGQVWGTDPATGKGANRRGIERVHIANTVAGRNRRRGEKAAG